MINLRFASWKVLFQVLEKNQFSHLELQKLFKEEKELEARDRAFIERVWKCFCTLSSRSR